MKLTNRQTNTLHRILTIEEDKEQDNYNRMMNLVEMGEKWAADLANESKNRLEELADLKTKLIKEIEITEKYGYTDVSEVQSNYLNLIADEITKKNQKRQSTKDTLKKIEKLLNEAYKRNLF